MESASDKYNEIILLHLTPTKFMDLKGIQLLLLFFAFLCAQVRKLDGHSVPSCILIERNALLGFKEGLKDSTNRLSSWVGDDCCTWEGVACDNRTGHVVKLDLRNRHPLLLSYPDNLLPYNNWSLGGELRPSLLGLKHLNYLDLSMNNFGGIRIPEFMGSFRQLKYLNLSNACLGGLIPYQLGNLSSLQYLDLVNDLGPYVFQIDNALWISHLSSLQYLDMMGAKFKEGTHWLQALNMLPSIVEVRLSDCEINIILLSLPYVNFTSLSILDLSDNSINSTMPGWLFNISSLEHLDLSYNDIRGIIPPVINNRALLKFLDLSHNQFLEGKILAAFGGLYKLQYLGLSGINISKNFFLPYVNFTSLSFLDLSYNSINSTIPGWLFNISCLEHLDLSVNDIRGIIPPTINNLASLKFLDLSSNQYLEGKIPVALGGLCKLQYLGLSGINISKNLHELDEVFFGCIKNSLETLNMRGTQLSGYLPEWLGDFRMLKSLDLSENSISGPIPTSIGRLSALQELYLFYNKLNGTIPGSFGTLVELAYLDLSYNMLNGTIPGSLGKLEELVSLELSSNFLEGVMSEEHFANWTKLDSLDLSNNQLILNLTSDWIPPFQLTDLHIDSCKLGPQFPTWLRMQKNICNLYLSSTGISDTLPDWFWRSFSQMYELDISSNGITGTVPDQIDFINLSVLNLSSNYFEGPLPNFHYSAMDIVDLSNNSFSGMIHPGIGKNMPNLGYLSLSTNNLSGEIPLSLCQLNLTTLDLSKNHLLGELPDCWNHSSRILVMDFSSNNLSGSIPPSICSIPFLESLHMSNNNLSGELPSSLKSCVYLNTLDLGQNGFVGTIPTWIGESLLSLKILRLRSNMLVGNIPPNLSRLSALQILDLADNNLSGAIPSSFGSFTAMKVLREMHGTMLLNTTYRYDENMQVTMKGTDVEYITLLPLVILVDLSDNNLSGTIPEELTSLLGLVSLNLSGNHLTGEITEKINALQQLEALDLSRNNLSGGIPSSMIALTFLSYLNLSYNNLSGRVPTGNQFQTFTDPSIYAGNLGLCGFPLTQKCKDDETNQGPNAIGGDEQNDNAMDKEGTEMKWLYMSMGLGFAVGLWAVFGPLLFNKKWSEAYFRLVDQVYDILYVAVVVIFNRFKEHNDAA